MAKEHSMFTYSWRRIRITRYKQTRLTSCAFTITLNASFRNITLLLVKLELQTSPLRSLIAIQELGILASPASWYLLRFRYMQMSYETVSNAHVRQRTVSLSVALSVLSGRMWVNICSLSSYASLKSKGEMVTQI